VKGSPYVERRRGQSGRPWLLRSASHRSPHGYADSQDGASDGD
jgi:hypothetical protein